MNKSKHVSIDEELFSLLVSYIDNHPDYDDPTYLNIRSLINEKLDAMYRHYVYTMYKSDSSSTVRSIARNEYLRLIGFSDSFVWNDDIDSNIN